jgi:hypothetical protein
MQENREPSLSERAGLAISTTRPALDLAWVLYGSALMIVLQLMTVFLSGQLLLGQNLDELMSFKRSVLVLGQVGLLLSQGYFLGGLLVGRLSSGRTILEPALSAVIPILLLLGYVLASKTDEFADSGLLGWTVVVAVVLCVICFSIAMLGGFLGEKLQEAAERKK